MKTILFGDKRPGLIETVAQHGTRLDVFDVIYERGLDERTPLMAEWENVKRDVKELKDTTPRGRERQAIWGTALTAIGFAIAGFIQAFSTVYKQP